MNVFYGTYNSNSHVIARALHRSCMLCVANLPRHKGTWVLNVNVCACLVPPRWTVEPHDQSVILGNAVAITCRADGFPKPTVIWKQAIGEQTGEYRELNYPTTAGGNGGAGASMAAGSSSLAPSSSAAGSLVESHANGTLAISRVAQEHGGHFLCQASNGIGADLSKLIRLTVHGKWGRIEG